MSLEPAGVLEHHRELAKFKLTPPFEFVEVERAEMAVGSPKNSDSTTGSRINAFEVAGALQQGHSGVEPLVGAHRRPLPVLANHQWLAHTRKSGEGFFQELGRRMAGIDERFGNPLVGVVKEKQASRGLPVATGAADFLVVGFERLRNVGCTTKWTSATIPIPNALWHDNARFTGHEAILPCAPGLKDPRDATAWMRRLVIDECLLRCDACPHKYSGHPALENTPIFSTIVPVPDQIQVRPIETAHIWLAPVIPSCSRMSSRTFGVAVAVSAITCGLPSSVTTLSAGSPAEIMPPEETQCAVHGKQATRICLSALRMYVLKSPGATYSSSGLLEQRARCDSLNFEGAVLLMTVAGTPSSSDDHLPIRAINGEQRA
jgi:hypothetical protein